jgi:hypothetical protein
MKNITPPTTGKILVHNHGTGLFSPADVASRAAEIALTNGRSSPTPDDFRQARQELHGDNLPPTSDSDETSSRGITRDPSEPVSNYGSEKPTQEAEDGQKATERLVLEGVEEAQHEQMVAGRRRRDT